MNKQQLLSQIETSHHELQQLLGQLTPNQMTTPFPETGWAVKDHLSHLLAWENGIVALLQYQPRHKAMGLDSFDSSMDDQNELIFRQNQHRPLSKVLQQFQSVHQQLLAILAPLTDNDLQLDYSHYQPVDTDEERDAPIWHWIAGNTYEHYDEHITWIQAALLTDKKP